MQHTSCRLRIFIPYMFKKESNKIKVISGKWKGRFISFPSIPNLRPGTGLMRETLLNWLRFDLQNKTVLDAFAGSGILGIDLLSNGVDTVHAIDQSHEAIAFIKKSCTTLQASDLHAFQGLFPDKLPEEVKKSCYDIVLLDPPYKTPVLNHCLGFLKQSSLIHKDTIIFCHMPHKIPDDWEHTWQIEKKSRRSKSQFILLRLK